MFDRPTFSPECKGDNVRREPQSRMAVSGVIFHG
jgi:hypothetical protein